jgi:hypothetical protein
MPNDPVTERPEANLLSNPVVNKAEDGARGNFPREGTKSEQLGRIAEARSEEMPEGVRARFLSSMFKTKMFTQKGQATASNLSDTKLPKRPMTAVEQEPETITAEDQGNVPTASSSGAPSFHVPADAGSLSDSDKETKRYLERMLMNATAESPFAQVSSITEVTKIFLGFDHSGAKEARAPITKEVSALMSEKGKI